MAKKSAAKVDVRLSYSSAKLLENCTAKYWHHKVAGTKKDADYEEGNAFAIGKAFHRILEVTKHGRPPTFKEVKKACEEFKCEDWIPNIHAMVMKHLKMHKKAKLTCIATEFEISEGDVFMGYVDGIFQNEKTGHWWIGDEKTASNLSETTFARLGSDMQLNLYSAFAPAFAKRFGLDMKKFKGAVYRVTTKPRSTIKPGEDYGLYVKRIIPGIKSVCIFVPKEKMDPKAAFEHHKENWVFSMQLRKGEVLPRKNLSYCDSFFRPCEFWSQCHGETFTNMKTSLKMVDGE